MTRVVWVGDRAMCWDQQLLNRLLSGPGWEHETWKASEPLLTGAGAVVVVPARFHDPYEVSDVIEALPWVVLILTSDEESTFNPTAVDHQNCHIWVMTPQPGLHEPSLRYMGEGSPDPTHLAELPLQVRGLDDRPFHVQFAGQVTHERREQMMEALQALPDTISASWLATEGFTQGMPRDQYLRWLTQSRVVLAPSGPATPDSFRTYEALEAGAVPIVDGHCPRYPDGGYWTTVYPTGVPFPVVNDWADELAKTVDHVLANWRPLATRCQAWWLQQQRLLLTRISDDVADLGGAAPAQEITALVPTSPTSDGPAAAFARLDRTVRSIMDRLPEGSEIVVMCDGVRSEQEHLRDQYEDFLGMVMWAAAHHWSGVLPLVFDHHAHQANMTRAALEHVRTPLVLFVEHDMPLEGEIPFEDLGAMVRSGYANVVRLGQDREREQYAELMLDEAPRWWEDVTHVRATVPFVRTIQWSQRPHLASTGFYRQMIGSYFGTQSRTMIEDVMHGVVQNAWHRHGQAGWEQFRLVFYAPGGNEARSRHLDGRGDDPKFPMVYAYDGDQPEGAPAPTVPLMERLRRGEHE